MTALWSGCTAARNSSRYRLRYLSQAQHRTLMALAEVLVLGEDAALTPEEVAAKSDDYLHSFARQEVEVQAGAHRAHVLPAAAPAPAAAVMSPRAAPEFLERCFISGRRRTPAARLLRRLVQTMFFAAQQLVFIAYYADPRTAAQTGYVPFSERTASRRR